MTNTFAKGETRAYNPEVDKDRDEVTVTKTTRLSFSELDSSSKDT